MNWGTSITKTLKTPSLAQISMTKNGYPFFMSNALPSNLTKSTGSNLSAAIFGPFSQVICGTWGGGLQFIIDPYTAKASGVLEVTAIAYHDVAVRHADAFAKIVDITTA